MPSVPSVRVPDSVYTIPLILPRPSPSSHSPVPDFCVALREAHPNGSSPGADELLPLLILTVQLAKPTCLHSCILYMQVSMWPRTVGPEAFFRHSILRVWYVLSFSYIHHHHHHHHHTLYPAIHAPVPIRQRTRIFVNTINGCGGVFDYPGPNHTYINNTCKLK